MLDKLSPIYILDCEKVDSFSTIKYDYDPPEVEFKRVALRNGRRIFFEGKYVKNNSLQALEEIAGAFLELENKQMIICVYDKRFALASERGKDLSYLLRNEYGLSKKQILTGNYLDFSEKDQWIYQGGILNIGLRDLE